MLCCRSLLPTLECLFLTLRRKGFHSHTLHSRLQVARLEETEIVTLCLVDGNIMKYFLIVCVWRGDPGRGLSKNIPESSSYYHHLGSLVSLCGARILFHKFFYKSLLIHLAFYTLSSSLVSFYLGLVFVIILHLVLPRFFFFFIILTPKCFKLSASSCTSFLISVSQYRLSHIFFFV